MKRPRKRKVGAAEHLVRLAKARRRLRAQRAINATQAEEHDKLKRQHSYTSAALDKSNRYLQMLLEQQQQPLHLEVLTALQKNDQHAKVVLEHLATAITSIGHSKKDADMNRPRARTGFNQLPFELRQVIWEMALPDRRVFEPLIRRGSGVIDFDVMHLLHTYPPPVIRGVCKEAWEVTETNGRFCFGLRGSGYFGYWFNPSRDLLFINRGGQDGFDYDDGYYDFFDHLDIYLERLKHTGACHLAFDYWFLWRRPEDIQEIKRFMPCCKTITMVDAADYMVEGTPIKAWYPLLDTDVSTSGENKIGGKDRTWAEEKERILAVWASMTTVVGNLPELIGIEVVRTERVTMRTLCA